MKLAWDMYDMTIQRNIAKASADCKYFFFVIFTAWARMHVVVVKDCFCAKCLTLVVRAISANIILSEAALPNCTLTLLYK